MAEERRQRREELMSAILSSKLEEMSVMIQLEDQLYHHGHLFKKMVRIKLKKMDDLVNSIERMKSNDQSASELFRTIISSVSQTEIYEMIITLRVRQLAELLTDSAFPKVQVEVAWALEYLIFRSPIVAKSLITGTTLPEIIPLLPHFPDQVTPLLGNIATASVDCRDYLLNSMALKGVSDLVNIHIPLSLSKIISRSLEQLCSGNPRPKFELVFPAIRALRVLLHSTDDEDVLIYSSWAYYISYNRIFKLISAADAETVELLQRLIALLQHSSRAVIIPTLITIANMVLRSSVLAQRVIDNNVLPILTKLLEAKSDILLLKQTCWLISMFTSGSKRQIQAVINHNLIPTLVELADSAQPESKKAAGIAISNAAVAAFPDQIVHLVEKGLIKALCGILSCDDPRIICMSLDGIHKVLSVGVDKGIEESRDVNFYAEEFDAVEGHQKILSLAQNENTSVGEKAAVLLKEYWCESETEDKD